VNPASGQADPKCPVCVGKSVYWEPAVDAAAAAANQKTQETWANMGRYEGGDIVITVAQNSPLYDAGKQDRVTMLNSADKFSQPLVRGAPTERLPFTPKTIERVFWLAPGTRAIMEADLPTLDGNGRLVWADGAVAPPPATTYSITGTKFSEYFLFDEFPKNRNMHYGARLPKMMVLRRFDLFGR
jgi:hypothetical protein